MSSGSGSCDVQANGALGQARFSYACDTSNDGPEMGQAVAEHNFPSNGCAGGHDDHGDGASDGASND